MNKDVRKGLGLLVVAVAFAVIYAVLIPLVNYFDRRDAWPATVFIVIIFLDFIAIIGLVVVGLFRIARGLFRG